MEVEEVTTEENLEDIIANGRWVDRLTFDDFDWEAACEDAEYYSDTTDGAADIFLASDYSSTFGSNHDNHSAEEFTGDYFDPFVDCIDTNQDYGLSRHFLEYADSDTNGEFGAYIAYIQLTGGTIPNEEEINRKILELTANDLWGRLNGVSVNTRYDWDQIIFMTDSYVTYNDAEKMSIVLDANIVWEGELVTSYIYAINVDLVNGEIMDNGEILTIDENFAAEFREKSNIQNGEDVVALKVMSDNELASCLSDSKTNIIFYSPMGMEVGYTYECTEDGLTYYGWVTATYKEYEEYLK